MRTYRTATVEVAPLDNAADVIEGIQKHPRSDGDWLYPPLERRAGDDGPEVYATSFSLLPTHSLILRGPGDSVELGNFLVQVLGLLMGLYLIPGLWTQFFRVALRIGMLTDFGCTTRDVERVLETAVSFWQSATDRVRHLIFGALHWYLFSQSYAHEFELFNAQCTVLDTCFRVHSKLHNGPPPRHHAHRAHHLATHHGVPVPPWATKKGKTCDLADLRNDLVHEARYAGAATGFAHPTYQPPIDLQLRNLNSRLLLGLLGVRSDYIHSPVDTCQSSLLAVK